MPTFGQTSEFGDVSNFDASSERMRGSPGTPGSSGIVDSIFAFLKSDSGTTQNIKAALYKVSDKSLVGSTPTASTSLTTTAVWKQFDFSIKPSVVGGTAYYIILWVDNNSATTIRMANQGVEAPTDDDYYSDAYSYNGFPDPVSLTITVLGFNSIYASYSLVSAQNYGDGLSWVVR